MREAGVEPFFVRAFLAGDAGENWLEQIKTVRPPSPRAQAAEFAAFQFAGIFHFHKFRQRKTGLLDAAQKFHGRFLVRQHNVVLATQKLRQVFQVARELRLKFRGIESFSPDDAAFGERIENENARRAAFGLRIDIYLRDELRVKAGGAAAFDVQ